MSRNGFSDCEREYNRREDAVEMAREEQSNGRKEMSALVKRKCSHCGGNQHEWYKIVDGKRVPYWECYHCGKREET